MKILFITHRFYPYIGGIEVNSEVLASEFQKEGHEIILLTWTEDVSDKIFPYTVIRKPNTKELFRLHAWADIIYENNPSLRLSWPAMFLFKKRVAAIRTWVRRVDGGMALQDYIKLLWLWQASGVIAISEAVRRQASKKAVVIGNPYRKELFKDLGHSRDKDFVFLGRLVSNKGADHAIQALHILIKAQDISQRKPTLSIIGDGPELVPLKKLAEELKIQEYISFTGALQGDELVEVMNQHKYLLVPSLWEEPFGNVALEGMACGCIPIVSDGGGLPDAVGNAGLVFKRGDVEALAASMNNILISPALAEELKERAKIHLAAHRPEIVAAKYLKVISSAL